MKSALLIPLFALTVPLTLAADPSLPGVPPRPRVTLSLVSELDAVVPGKPITVALRLIHEPGWHSYWRNAGTLGLPTSIKWSLPPGYSAGDIQWQRPRVTKMAAYHVWGYEGDAFLLTDIVVPPEAAAPIGSNVTLTATVTYMACEKTCCPDEAKLSITLPVRRDAKPVADHPAKFDAVRREQPATTDAWHAAVTRTGDTYTLTLSPADASKVNRSVDSLYFFGYDRVISSDAPQQLHRDGDKLVLTLKQEVHTPDDRATHLRGILVTDAGLLANNAAHVIAIDVPIVER